MERLGGESRGGEEAAYGDRGTFESVRTGGLPVLGHVICTSQFLVPVYSGPTWNRRHLVPFLSLIFSFFFLLWFHSFEKTKQNRSF